MKITTPIPGKRNILSGGPPEEERKCDLWVSSSRAGSEILEKRQSESSISCRYRLRREWLPTRNHDLDESRIGDVLAPCALRCDRAFSM